MNTRRATSSGTILLLAGAAAGLAVATYNYLMPLTGVNGTFGAGLVILSTAIMAVAALLMIALQRGAGYSVLGWLALLDVVLTGIAGWFLHEWFLIAAMVIALFGGIRALTRRAKLDRMEARA